jgi:inosine-uridine nucleoside N-ribohydrolase
MHDSTAVLAYLYPELFEFKTCGIRVECEKGRYGESTIAKGNNVQLVTKTDPEHLLKIITNSIITENGREGES